jgi:hypothetical protein
VAESWRDDRSAGLAVGRQTGNNGQRWRAVTTSVQVSLRRGTEFAEFAQRKSSLKLRCANLLFCGESRFRLCFLSFQLLRPPHGRHLLPPCYAAGPFTGCFIQGWAGPGLPALAHWVPPPRSPSRPTRVACSVAPVKAQMAAASLIVEGWLDEPDLDQAVAAFGASAS